MSASPPLRRDIFICYRKDDSAGASGRLLENLRARFGHERVFFDASAIGGGERYRDVIDAGLARAAVFLPVIGERWLTLTEEGARRIDLEDDVLRGEIETALREGLHTMPVLLEETRMPSAAELPTSIARLAEYQGHRLSHETWDADVARLLAAVERKLPPAERRRSAISLTPAQRSAIAATVVTFSAFAGWYQWKLWDQERDEYGMVPMEPDTLPTEQVRDPDEAVEADPTTPPLIIPGRYGRSTAETTRLREGPTVEAETVALLRQGVVFEILERRENWMRIKLQSGQVGWIAAVYVNSLDGTDTMSVGTR